MPSCCYRFQHFHHSFALKNVPCVPPRSQSPVASSAKGKSYLEFRKLIRVQSPHGSNFEIRSARYSDLKHKLRRNLRITNAQTSPMILVDLPRAGWWLGFFWLRNFHPLVVSFKYVCFDLCFDCGQNSQPSLKESCGAVHSPFRSYKSEAY